MRKKEFFIFFSILYLGTLLSGIAIGVILTGSLLGVFGNTSIPSLVITKIVLLSFISLMLSGILVIAVVLLYGEKYKELLDLLE